MKNEMRKTAVEQSDKKAAARIWEIDALRGFLGDVVDADDFGMRIFGVKASVVMSERSDSDHPDLEFRHFIGHRKNLPFWIDGKRETLEYTPKTREKTGFAALFLGEYAFPALYY